MTAWLGNASANVVGGVLAALIVSSLTWLLNRRGSKSPPGGTPASGNSINYIKSTHRGNNVAVDASTHIEKVIIAPSRTVIRRESPIAAGGPTSVKVDDDDYLGPLFVYAVVGLVVVGAYARFQEAVLTTLLSATIFTAAFTLTAIFFSVVTRVAFTVKMWLLMVVASCGLVICLFDLRVLKNPLYASGNYSQLLSGVRKQGALGFAINHGSAGIMFLVYQIFGVCLAFIALLFTLGFGMNTVARINEALGVAAGRPTPFWKAIEGKTPGGWHAAVVIALCGLLSLGFASGYVFNFYEQKVGPRLAPVSLTASVSSAPTSRRSVCVQVNNRRPGDGVGHVELLKRKYMTGAWSDVGHPLLLDSQGKACLLDSVKRSTEYRWELKGLKPLVMSNVVSVRVPNAKS